MLFGICKTLWRENDMSGGITYEDARRLLASIHPYFALAQSEVVEEWSPDEPPSVIFMSAVASAIASKISEFSNHDLQTTFGIVERLLVNGNDLVKDAVATGLLETLLAESSAQKLDFAVLSSFLGAESKMYCIAWDRFTGCRTAGLSE